MRRVECARRAPVRASSAVQAARTSGSSARRRSSSLSRSRSAARAARAASRRSAARSAAARRSSSSTRRRVTSARESEWAPSAWCRAVSASSAAGRELLGLQQRVRRRRVGGLLAGGGLGQLGGDTLDGATVALQMLLEVAHAGSGAG